jgi:Skp family chaperone for outer membrane proteins
MKTLLITAALAASVLSTSAFAQQRGGVIVVDSDRILTDCTACQSANTQLRTRAEQLQQRQSTLQQQLQTEGKPIQAAVDALNGKDPDAALKQKITAYETKARNAQQELATSKNTLDSTLAHVQQQIGGKLVAVVEQVRARHGAAIAVAKNSTIANDNSVDVTSEVLTALNQQLPSVSVTPLPQQQSQSKQPQGR